MEKLVAVLAWPAVVLVIALVAILAFRAQLAGLIGRTKKVGKGGIETFDAQPVQPTDKTKGLDDFFRSFDNPLLADAEQRIMADLNNRKIEASADREKVLVRALAASNIIQHFERTHAAIWASQLACLQYLNPRDNGVTTTELMPLYETAKANYPNLYDDRPFERWLGFLSDFNLVTESDSRVCITVTGREFLQYLVAAKKVGPFHG